MPPSQRYFRNPRPEMAAFLPRDYQKVLEVGCGAGFFTRHLKPGCEVWGVEVETTQARVAAGKMAHVLEGAYDRVAHRLPADYFDMAVCNDIIEHMADHDAFLRSVTGKIKPGGCLVGSVPNVRFYKHLKELLLKRDWRYREKGILDRTHLRFFTERSLKRTLRSHGYVIEKHQGINIGLEKFKDHFLFGVLLFLTMGSWSDTRFLQFGFRARKTRPSIHHKSG